ncbi:MAG TPA: HEAT repeat domain-containing protein [Methanomicrobiales archaeon]|jgi:HEAT repeat protein|nr:HEAT repeat domain-containing protein [Methanomicrobiales archaeon]
MPERTYQKLKDKGNAERWKYAVELGKHGKAAIDLLVSSLSDEDKWVRYLVIDALGNIRDPQVLNPLVAALGDLDQDVRFIAAEALGRVGDPKAIEALEKTCTSDNCYVRIAAEEAIDRLKQG